MLERLPPGRRNLALLLLFTLSAWFLWTVRSVVNPLLLGYLLAYILLPLVARLERRRLSRRAAVNLIFVAGFVLATVLLVAFAAQLRALAIDTYDALQGQEEVAADGAAQVERTPLRAKLQRRSDEFTGTLREWGLDVGRIEVPDMEELRAQGLRLYDEYGGGRAGVSALGRTFSFLARVLGGVLSVLALLFLVPLYTYFFLFVIGDLHGSIQRYFPRRERARLTRIFERIGEVISSFFRGRLTVAFLKGLLLAIGLTLAGMPYGFLFGMLSGALSIVPFVGAFGGFVLALAVGIVEHGVIGSVVRAGIVFGLGEVVEGYVLVPKVLGDRLGLHPLVVFFALLAGGAAMGMFGFLISLPLTATLVILFQELVSPALKQFADEPG